MKRGREYIDYLKDILDSIEQTEKFIDGFDFERFSSDNKTRFAVVRALEVIGEASKKIPAMVKQQNPTLPWREMVGIRDKLIHEYFGLNVLVIWKTVYEDLPRVKPLISAIIEKTTRESETTEHKD
jgi:uncharacterized protein with HEPN domain